MPEMATATTPLGIVGAPAGTADRQSVAKSGSLRSREPGRQARMASRGAPGRPGDLAVWDAARPPRSGHPGPGWATSPSASSTGRAAPSALSTASVRSGGRLRVALARDLLRDDAAQELTPPAGVDQPRLAVVAGDQTPEPPSTTSDTDIEAQVPMLRMYSRWIGETLRRPQPPRSSGRPSSGLDSGAIGRPVAGVGNG
jgi:hypothetical protein